MMAEVIQIDHDRVQWFFGRIPHDPGRIRRGRRVGHYCPIPSYFTKCLWHKKGISKRHKILIEYIQFHTTAYPLKYKNREWCRWEFSEIGKKTGLNQNLSIISLNLKDMNIIEFGLIKGKVVVKINYVIADWILTQAEWGKMKEIIEEEFAPDNE